MSGFAKRFDPAALVLCALVVASGVLGSVPSAHAQAMGATVSGVVTDESGAVVAGAWLTLANAADGVQRQATANDRGEYAFAGLPPGRYVLSAGRDGFAPLQMSHIDLEEDDRRVVPVILKIGPLAEAVHVEGRGSYTTRETGAATRMPLSLRETPQSLSVIGQQQLQDQNLRTLDDVLKQTPGIAVQRRDERVNYFSRGFTLNQMIDGMPTLAYNSVAAEASMATTVIYDRVEVVRGPAGLLNGVGQPGGSVNLVRKRPMPQLSGTASLGASSWNPYLAQIDVAGPLLPSGALRGRVVAFHTSGDGFIDRKNRNDEVIYGIVEADVTPRTTVSGGFEYQRTDIDAANFGSAPPFYNDRTLTRLPRSFNTSASWSVWNMDTRRGFLELAHRTTGGWQFKASGSYLKNSRERYSADIWLDPANISPVTNIGTVQLGDNPADGTNATFDAYTTGAFRLLGRTHQLAVGVNMNRYSYETRTNMAINTGTMIDQRQADIFNLDAIVEPDFPYPRLYFGADVEEKAVYASTRLRALDAVSILAGGRLTWFDNEPWTRRWFSGGDGALVDGVATERNGVFTPYAGVVYDVLGSYSVYASYTEIFTPNTVNDATGTVLEPQRGSNVEVGIKGEHLGGALNTSLSVFRTRQDNVPVQSGVQPDGTPAYIGVRGTRTQGFEVTASGELARDWHLLGGYTYSAPRRSDGSLLTPNLPTRLFTAVTTYRLPGAWNRLVLGANANHQNATTLRDPYGLGTTRQGAVTLFGGTASFDISRRLSLSLNVENVTDEAYVSFTTTGYVYGNPRNAWVRATYRF